LHQAGFNNFGNNTSRSNDVSYSIYLNGTVVQQSAPAGQTSSLMFDGLSDTYWTSTYAATSPGVVTLKLDVRSLSASAISKIYGRLVSEKPSKIILQIADSTTNTGEPKVFTAQSEEDHDNFVFNFQSTTLSSISIFIIKNEPDRMVTSSGSTVYEYDFSIRELAISGPYYDTSATYVSYPITINSTDNTKYTIDRVSLDAQVQSGLQSSIDFFIAQDNPDALTVDDFDWRPISPENFANKINPNFIDFNGSNLEYLNIVNSSSVGSSARNIQYFDESPTRNIPGFENISLYRIAKLNSEKDYIEPIILEGTNRYSWYRVPYIQGLSRDNQRWKNQILSGADTTVQVIESNNTISSSSSFWTAPNLDSGGSVYISLDILCPQDITFEKTFSKDDQNSSLWDVSIYLNGSLISTISNQINTANILWNLKKGKNNIAILIDAAPKNAGETYGGLSGSITLLQQARINQYGYIYQNYLSSINKYMLRDSNSVLNNVFSIIEIDTEKYIVSNKKILPDSRIYFYNNNSTFNTVNSIRVKAEMRRPLRDSKSTPMLTSYRLKFKRSETIADSISISASDAFGG
jgi:hypothetical protein